MKTKPHPHFENERGRYPDAERGRRYDSRSGGSGRDRQSQHNRSRPESEMDRYNDRDKASIKGDVPKQSQEVRRNVSDQKESAGRPVSEQSMKEHQSNSVQSETFVRSADKPQQGSETTGQQKAWSQSLDGKQRHEDRPVFENKQHRKGSDSKETGQRDRRDRIGSDGRSRNDHETSKKRDAVADLGKKPVQRKDSADRERKRWGEPTKLAPVATEQKKEESGSTETASVASDKSVDKSDKKSDAGSMSDKSSIDTSESRSSAKDAKDGAVDKGRESTRKKDRQDFQDRPDKSNRQERTEKSFRSDHSNRRDRPERFDRPPRGGRREGPGERRDGRGRGARIDSGRSRGRSSRPYSAGYHSRGRGERRYPAYEGRRQTPSEDLEVENIELETVNEAAPVKDVTDQAPKKDDQEGEEKSDATPSEEGKPKQSYSEGSFGRNGERRGFVPRGEPSRRGRGRGSTYNGRGRGGQPNRSTSTGQTWKDPRRDRDGYKGRDRGRDNEPEWEGDVIKDKELRRESSRKDDGMIDRRQGDRYERTEYKGRFPKASRQEPRLRPERPPRFQNTRGRGRGRGGREPRGRGGTIRSSAPRTSSSSEGAVLSAATAKPVLMKQNSSDLNNEEWETASESSDFNERRDKTEDKKEKTQEAWTESKENIQVNHSSNNSINGGSGAKKGPSGQRPSGDRFYRSSGRTEPGENNELILHIETKMKI